MNQRFPGETLIINNQVPFHTDPISPVLRRLKRGAGKITPEDLTQRRKAAKVRIQNQTVSLLIRSLRLCVKQKKRSKEHRALSHREPDWMARKGAKPQRPEGFRMSPPHARGSVWHFRNQTFAALRLCVKQKSSQTGSLFTSAGLKSKTLNLKL